MKKLPSKSLVYDISNILFRVASVQKYSNPFARDATPEDLVGLCMHISIQSVFRWYQKFQPDFVVFAFEGGNNWRKKYTAEVKARLAYKGNRVQDPEMAHYYKLIDSFHTTMKSHTSICCLKVDEMEADDSIGGYCQLYASPDHEITVVSGDRDFTQLLKLPNVKLVDPATGKLRNQRSDKDYVEDIDYWLFTKCIRGDMGDYVPSAYPRIRQTRIRKAYDNTYERANLMNERWTDDQGVNHRVGDLYEQNVLLLDLFQQPQQYRDSLLEGIKTQVSDLGHYSHFHFLRFLDEFQLNKLRDEAMKYVELFANNQRFLKGEAAPKTVLNKEEKQAYKEAREDTDGDIIDMSGSTSTKRLMEF